MSSHDGPDPDAKTLHAVPSTNRLVDELCGAKLAPVLILLSIYIVTRGGGGERNRDSGGRQGRNCGDKGVDRGTGIVEGDKGGTEEMR